MQLANLEMEVRVLSDLRVVELGDHTGMQYAGKIFADMGAAVTRIVPRAVDAHAPDPAREKVKQTHRIWLNTNKTSLALDPASVSDREALITSLRKATIVLDSRSVALKESGDLTLDKVRQINPDAQIVSVSDFGDTGPYKDFRASDGIIRALNGTIYPNGPVDRPMMISDHQASIFQVENGRRRSHGDSRTQTALGGHSRR